MAEMMRLQIVTPDEAFFDGEVSMVELNTADGEAGIYPKHIPMVVAVAPGVLKIHGADGVKKAALLSERVDDIESDISSIRSDISDLESRLGSSD